MSSLAICPDCGGEYPVHLSRVALGVRVEGRCPQCGRDRSYIRFDQDEETEPEPELVQDGWRVDCYEPGDDEHISHEWSRYFKTEDEATRYAKKWRNNHVHAEIHAHIVVRE